VNSRTIIIDAHINSLRSPLPVSCCSSFCWPSRSEYPALKTKPCAQDHPSIPMALGPSLGGAFSGKDPSPRSICSSRLHLPLGRENLLGVRAWRTSASCGGRTPSLPGTGSRSGSMPWHLPISGEKRFPFAGRAPVCFKFSNRPPSAPQLDLRARFIFAPLPITAFRPGPHLPWEQDQQGRPSIRAASRPDRPPRPTKSTIPSTPDPPCPLLFFDNFHQPPPATGFHVKESVARRMGAQGKTASAEQTENCPGLGWPSP